MLPTAQTVVTIIVTMSDIWAQRMVWTVVSLFAFLTCSEGKSSFCLSLFINFVSYLHFYNKIHVFLKQIPELTVLFYAFKKWKEEESFGLPWWFRG